MSIEVDESRRRVTITAGPGFSGRAMAEGVARLFEQTPQAASYDIILDVRGTQTGATMDDYRIAAEAYARTPRSEGRKHTCYVTVDTNYPLMAAALTHLFPDREQKFFVTPESASRFLDGLG
jgi:hypothetical protein